ncbi:MAG TPA: toprim domain-containing protein, partial [Candidatus Glassbacteria bacterium]|nr:toprim domain-containing protein [Candidatus Glassbacteria bacterium]
QRSNCDPVKMLETTGVASFKYKKGKGNSSFYYHNPLLIPFFDVYGKPVSIAGRTMYSEEEMKLKQTVKYKNLPFTRSNHLFGLNWAHKYILKQDKVFLVEGQFDFTSMFVNGYKNTVALCSASLGDEHFLLLKRFTNNFYVLLDNDEAGDKGWKSIKKRASIFNINPTRIFLPKEFHDVYDCLALDPSSLSI